MSATPINRMALGQKSEYLSHYSPELLFPIARKPKRDEIAVPSPLRFYGYDRWNAYEVSWLNLSGKPQVAIAEFDVPCDSPFIVESKSLKLYLISCYQTKFADIHALKATLEKDLSASTGAPVIVNLRPPKEFTQALLVNLPGTCIDELPVTTDIYEPNPDFLTAQGSITTETLHSHLLKSNCLVTNQPDWASLFVEYTGPQIDHEGLLKYLISFRLHNEFHEQCVERIFMDIQRRCHPTSLTVYACYTRRGGLDINPIRSTDAKSTISPIRLVRQ